MRKQLLLGLALITAAPALADVKAGVDAWAKGDFKRAVDSWRGPAVGGDPDAQFNLAQAYKLGRGVPVDPAQAESWFHKAALQGHEQAEDNYALALFQAGRKADALPWLEKSVARGEPRTELVLGTMLFNGDAAPRDYSRAYALMTRAAAAGLPSAAQTLAQMDQYITPVDREHGVALAQQLAAQPVGRAAAQPVQVAARAPAAKPTPAKPVKVQMAPGLDAPQPMMVGYAKPDWRAQLGAFHDRANAEALWARVKPRLSRAAPDYVAAGGLIKLQATGFTTKAEARAACARAGVPCTVVAPKGG